MRLLLLLLAISILPACKAYDRVIATVTFDPVTEQFHIELLIEDAGTDLFGCDTLKACKKSIPEALNLEGNSPFVRRLHKLQDADNLRASAAVVGTEGQLDLKITYDAYPGTRAAEQIGLRIEKEIRPGKKSRSRIVITPWGDIEILQGKFTQRIQYLPHDDGTRVLEVYAFAYGTNQVVYSTTSDVGENPTHILADLPGLQQALESDGVIQ